MTATSRIVVRYLNLSGALVTIAEHDTTSPRGFNARCTACLDAMPEPLSLTLGTLKNCREWAGSHAAACRALPQPDEQA